MKYIQFKLPWFIVLVPVSVVAINRSTIYEEPYKESVEFFDSYPDEAIDWLQNNMNPEDFKGESIIVRDVVNPWTEWEWWMNQEMSIITPEQDDIDDLTNDRVFI